MRTNTKTKTRAYTYEGGQAMSRQTAEMELQRTIATCLLWEDTFYASGNQIAKRIADLITQVSPDVAADLAVRARRDLYLRDVPLFVLRETARQKVAPGVLSGAMEQVITRPDQMTEFLSLYWKGKKQPLTKQVKRGLAQAFARFSPYQLAKYNRDDPIKLRDVMFMVHPKPQNNEQAQTWKALVDGTLQPPDTWEVMLSTGKDKKATWEALLKGNQLGYLALIRNLRNMSQAGVDRSLILKALEDRAEKAWGIFPFQFVSAYRFAPEYVSGLEAGFKNAVKSQALSGTTFVVVDVSGSMNAPLSSRGKVDRIDAATSLAMVLKATGSDVRVFTFSNTLVEVPALQGFGLLEKVKQSQPHGGTYLDQALTTLKNQHLQGDRVIVITDEQAHDRLTPKWTSKAYVLNVAPYQPALNTDTGWVRVNGFSDRVVEWISLMEKGEWGLGQGTDS